MQREHEGPVEPVVTRARRFHCYSASSHPPPVPPPRSPGKKARAEQYSEEELVARGKGYANSLFRAAQEGHGLKGIFGDVPKN